MRKSVLAHSIASRATVTPARIVYTGHDWTHDKATITRKARSVAGTVLVHVRVEAELVDGRDEAYTLDEILPEEEARYALGHLLATRTINIRPKLPA